MKGSVYDTQNITDAERRRDAAKDRLEHQDNAGCVRESQAAVELAIKALLELLDIEYPPEHDMSDQIPKAIIKLERALAPKRGFESAGTAFQAHWIRNDLSMVTITARVLSSIKDYAVYGIQEAGIPAGTMFLELGLFAKECYEQANVAVTRLRKLIQELLSGSIESGGQAQS